MFSSFVITKPTIPFAGIYELKRNADYRLAPDLEVMAQAQTMPSGAIINLAMPKADNKEELVPFIVKNRTATAMISREATPDNPVLFHIDIPELKYIIYVYSPVPELVFTLVTAETYNEPFARLGLVDMYKQFCSQGGSLEYPAKGTFDARLMQLKKSYENETAMKSMEVAARTQGELDQVKQVLHQTIERVIERGDHIDALVHRSNELSQSTKAFYTEAKSKDTCCLVM